MYRAAAQIIPIRDEEEMKMLERLTEKAVLRAKIAEQNERARISILTQQDLEGVENVQ